MWKIAEATMLLFLGIGAVWDVRMRCVSSRYLMVGTVLAVMFQIIWGSGIWYLWAAGAVSGGLFLVISKCSKEGIGYGDSWMILNLGIFLGVWRLLAVLVMAFGGTVAAAVCGGVKGKYSRKSSIPFLPFLLAGYVGGLLW